MPVGPSIPGMSRFGFTVAMPAIRGASGGIRRFFRLDIRAHDCSPCVLGSAARTVMDWAVAASMAILPVPMAMTRPPKFDRWVTRTKPPALMPSSSIRSTCRSSMRTPVTRISCPTEQSSNVHSRAAPKPVPEPVPLPGWEPSPPPGSPLELKPVSCAGFPACEAAAGSCGCGLCVPGSRFITYRQ